MYVHAGKGDANDMNTMGFKDSRAREELNDSIDSSANANPKFDL